MSVFYCMINCPADCRPDLSRFAGELLLESGQSFDIAQGGLLNRSGQHGSLFLAGTLGTLVALAGLFGFFRLVGILEDSAVAEDDALGILVEFDYLEVEFLIDLGLRAVFLDEVLGSGEALDSVGKLDNCALVEHLDDGTLMYGTGSEHCLEYFPGILLKLLVAQGEATVVLVDFEDDNFDVGADLGEFRRMFYFLGPGEVGNVDEAVYALFDFNEYSEVGKVAHFGGVLASDGIFDFDILPGILLELLEAEAHLALLAVEGKDDGFHFVADFEEVLSGTQVLRPAHFADVDQALDAGSNLHECAVIGHDDNFSLDLVADFEFGCQGIPGMGHELLETQGDALLLVVEVENNDVELLVKLHNFLGVVYAAPGEVGDVDKTIYAAQIDEHTVGGDVLDGSLENLTFFEFGDNLALLLLEFGLDESLVGNDNVLEFGVDFDNLEFHGLANEDIIVTDGLDVDLRTGQEGLDAEDVDDHAAFGAALDVTLDDFVVFEGLVDAFPGAGSARLAVRQDKLALLVFLIFDEHFHNVAHLDVGIVAEFVHGDDTVGLVADVNHSLTFVQGDDGTFDYVLVFDGVERFIVGLGKLLARLLALVIAVFVGIPVEIGDRRVFNFFSHLIRLINREDGVSASGVNNHTSGQGRQRAAADRQLAD